MPALIMIYSAIDSVSWLATENKNDKVGDRFKAWVDNWMLKAFHLPCSSEELYGARCGILHTLTADSTLSEKKNIRCIYYAWGNSETDDLETTFDDLNRSDLVAVHLEDLYEAFKLGMANFLENVTKDKELTEKINKKSNRHFTNVDKEIVKTYLNNLNDRKS